MWHDLLQNGQYINDLDDVTAGDVVFLNCDATPYLAFTVFEIKRRNGSVYMHSNTSRYYIIGGNSIVTFDHAIRPRHHITPEAEKDVNHVEE